MIHKIFHCRVLVTQWSNNNQCLLCPPVSLGSFLPTGCHSTCFRICLFYFGSQTSSIVGSVVQKEIYASPLYSYLSMSPAPCYISLLLQCYLSMFSAPYYLHCQASVLNYKLIDRVLQEGPPGSLMIDLQAFHQKKSLIIIVTVSNSYKN